MREKIKKVCRKQSKAEVKIEISTTNCAKSEYSYRNTIPYSFIQNIYITLFLIL